MLFYSNIIEDQIAHDMFAPLEALLNVHAYDYWRSNSYLANIKDLYNIHLGPTSLKLAQHSTNAMQMFCVCWVAARYCG